MGKTKKSAPIQVRLDPKIEAKMVEVMDLEGASNKSEFIRQAINERTERLIREHEQRSLQYRRPFIKEEELKVAED